MTFAKLYTITLSPRNILIVFADALSDEILHQLLCDIYAMVFFSSSFVSDDYL